MKKILLLAFLSSVFGACDREDVVPQQKIVLAFEITPSDINGRTQDGPGIRRGYVFTGECFEYGTIVTDSQGEEHFWPADTITKLNGFHDICPGPDEAYAFQKQNPSVPATFVSATVRNQNTLVSTDLKKTQAIRKGTQTTVTVFELIN